MQSKPKIVTEDAANGVTTTAQRRAAADDVSLTAAAVQTPKSFARRFARRAPPPPSPGGETKRTRTLFPNAPFVFGAAEIVGTLAALLLLAGALISYFYLLQPARKRLETANAQRRKDESLLRDAGAMAQGGTPEIIASLRQFEQSNLAAQIEGQTAIIAELNSLVARNGARNAGFEFVSLEPSLNPDGTIARSVRSSASAALQTVYPGIAVRMSVEGAYPNLRRLIKDIEASSRFIVINNVELESGNEMGASLVTLRLDTATYFRPLTTPAAQP